MVPFGEIERHGLIVTSMELAAACSGEFAVAGGFSEVVELPIVDLVRSDSPRIKGIDDGYTRLLADLAEEFPPIVVHRETMQVIDGNHRVYAAQLRGRTTIAAVLYDGDAKSAFVLAVRFNVTHGLPLTMAERKAAVRRMLTDHPQWSDRAIASVSGISDKTVAAIRRNDGLGEAQSDLRIGRNGAVHRSVNERGRSRAAELLTADPCASLREIALEAGISLTTAKDVRNRLRRGEKPIPAARAKERSNGIAGRQHVRRESGQAVDPEYIMRCLQGDPSLRFSEAGRSILRWLASSKIDSSVIGDLMDNVPQHCAGMVAELARQRSSDWRRFAALLDEQVDGKSLPDACRNASA